MIEFEIRRRLRNEPLAVLMLFQSHCDYSGSTKPHLEALQAQHGFKLLGVRCDHLSPAMAGSSLPSVSVFRYGQQVSAPLRGARRRDVLHQYLSANGVIQ